MVDARLIDADVVAHDEKDVGLPRLLLLGAVVPPPESLPLSSRPVPQWRRETCS